MQNSISVIVPTIGRPASLTNLLDSLSKLTVRVSEVIIADGSDSQDTKNICNDVRWSELHIIHVPIQPPNAVRQRNAAIKASSGDFLLFLDDDIVLEPQCVEHLLGPLIATPSIVATVADFNNESWSNPTRIWSLYIQHILGIAPGDQQGRVIGPLLRFGFNPTPASPQSMEWIGTCDSLVRRAAFDQCGGFSDFFLHRCTMNEDVDLGIKLARLGSILFCPSARLAHYHAPSGRVTPQVAAEDDVFNRFMVLSQTIGHAQLKALRLALMFVFIESFSNILGSIIRLQKGTTMQIFIGRMRGLWRIAQYLWASRGK